MGYEKLTINGHEFGFSYGDGVIVKPSLAKLDDKDYIEALKLACQLMPVVESFMVLADYGTHSFYGKTMNRVSEEDLERVVTLYNEVKDNGVIGLTEELSLFIAGVLSEYDRRQEKKSKKSARTNATEGYVYLIQSPSGFFKIGRTVNPQDRLRTFEVKLPFEVEYICLIQTSDMYRLESELHSKFKHLRVNGEWFNLSEQDVKHIRSLVAQS